MPETVKRFALGFASLVWRLVVYFAVLIAALKLLSMAYGGAMQGLGVHFAHSPAVRPAEGVGFGEARLLIAAVLALGCHPRASAVTGWDRSCRFAPRRFHTCCRGCCGAWAG